MLLIERFASQGDELLYVVLTPPNLSSDCPLLELLPVNCMLLACHVRGTCLAGA